MKASVAAARAGECCQKELMLAKGRAVATVAHKRAVVMCVETLHMGVLMPELG